jgi:hypothetical protein
VWERACLYCSRYDYESIARGVSRKQLRRFGELYWIFDIPTDAIMQVRVARVETSATTSLASHIGQGDEQLFAPCSRPPDRLPSCRRTPLARRIRGRSLTRDTPASTLPSTLLVAQLDRNVPKRAARRA